MIEKTVADNELITELADIQEAIADLMTQESRLKAELHRRMQERGAKEMPHAQYRVSLVTESPTYDVSVLAQLREKLPEDWLHKCWTPGYIDTSPREVKERWSGQHLNSAEKQLGGEVAEIIKRARLPGQTRISIKRKES